MDENKLTFLKKDFLLLLQSLKADAKGQWGLMNGQQMVEHFVDVVKNASGKLQFPLINNGVEPEKMRAFLFSEKPFAQNIRNPYIGEQPRPVKLPDMQTAIEKLRKELVFFFDSFENDASLTTINPFFGELDYTGNVQLLYKHALHHLNQFGLMNQ